MKKVLIISLAALLAGYAAYSALAQYEFSRGQAAFEAKDWLTAWGHFERVGGLYRFALPSHSSEATIWRDQSSILLFGQSMREKGDYESALDAYGSFMTLYPEPESAALASAMLAPTMLEWSQALHQNKQFEEEIEILYELVADYKDTPEAQQANQQIITAYDSLGRQLMDNGSFILSIQAYEDARGVALDEEIRSVVEEGYEDAVQGLATDKGTDGLQVISETLETACAGQAAVSPAVGILKSVPGKGLVCSGTDQFSMPDELTPSMPGEFKYVVSIEYSDETVETCYYSSTGILASNVLLRVRKAATVTVYSTVTGIETGQDYFFGSEPAECPQERAFGTSLADSISGSKVDDEEIASWLETIFEE